MAKAAKGKQLNIYVDDEMISDIDRLADRLRLSRSGLVLNLMVMGLQRMGEVLPLDGIVLNGPYIGSIVWGGKNK